MKTIKINYNDCISSLYEIEKKYVQSNNRKYTIFYDTIFNDNKDKYFEIALLGFENSSYTSVFKEYFVNSNIYNLKSDIDIIFNKNDNEYVKYDIVICNNDENYEKKIKIINKFLKPSGIIIIENILRINDENNYFYDLKDILYNFKNYFFIEVDYKDIDINIQKNNKLFILIKNGPPIFEKNNKLTIITPCYRIENIHKLKESINFNYLEEWIIVYDGTKIIDNPYIFENMENIKEYVNKDDGASGNPQRNFALSKIKNLNSLIYFLDDDNIMHPFLYEVLKFLDKNRMYTFNQNNNKYFNNTLLGNNVSVCNIDSAMALISGLKLTDKKWNTHDYTADGIYLSDCYENNKNNHIYINNTLSYYNKLQKNT